MPLGLLHPPVTHLVLNREWLLNWMDHTFYIFVYMCTNSAFSNGCAAWFWGTSCCRIYPCMPLHAMLRWIWIRMSFQNTTFNANLKEGAKNINKKTMSMAIKYLQREKKTKLHGCRKMHTTEPQGASVQLHCDKLQRGKSKRIGQGFEFHANRKLSTMDRERSSYPRRNWSERN